MQDEVNKAIKYANATNEIEDLKMTEEELKELKEALLNKMKQIEKTKDNKNDKTK